MDSYDTFGNKKTADGKIKTHVARVAGLSEISQVLKDLGEGKYAGRAIIDMVK